MVPPTPSALLLPRLSPRLLAIDCATERLVLAVVCGEQVWRADEPGAAATSSRLLPAVMELLAQAGLQLADLDAIAFGRGPGAFTGLRSACSVAQGLALGAGKPVLAIDSLALVADEAAHNTATDDAVWVAMDARMDEVYAAAYRAVPAANGGTDWQVVEAPALWPLAALAAQWQATPPHCVAGSALAAFGDRLLPSAVACRRVAQPTDRAGALARLAVGAWRRGEAVDAALALPLYLRDKVAMTSAERAQRLRAAA